MSSPPRGPAQEEDRRREPCCCRSVRRVAPEVAVEARSGRDVLRRGRRRLDAAQLGSASAASRRCSRSAALARRAPHGVIVAATSSAGGQIRRRPARRSSCSSCAARGAAEHGYPVELAGQRVADAADASQRARAPGPTRSCGGTASCWRGEPRRSRACKRPRRSRSATRPSRALRRAGRGLPIASPRRGHRALAGRRRPCLVAAARLSERSAAVARPPERGPRASGASSASSRWSARGRKTTVAAQRSSMLRPADAGEDRRPDRATLRPAGRAAPRARPARRPRGGLDRPGAPARGRDR